MIRKIFLSFWVLLVLLIFYLYGKNTNINNHSIEFAAIIMGALVLIASKVFNTDKFFLFCVSANLTLLGLIMITRLNSQLGLKQSHWVITSWVILLVIVYLPFKIDDLTKYSLKIYVFMLLILTITALFGFEKGGARNWLLIGNISIQPSEFFKLAYIIFLANILDCSFFEKRMLLKPRFLFLITIPFVILSVQNELGSGLILYLVFITMLYSASGKKVYPIIGFKILVACLIASYYIFPHVKIRFDMWLNPWEHPFTTGYQLLQSFFAFAKGGIFGTGLGWGKPQLIPAVTTDFIFSAIAEEFGLTALIAIITFYIILILSTLKLVSSKNSRFSCLLTVGIISMIGWQSIIILNGVMGVIPLTGITLPFISYGGSSLIAFHIALAMMIKTLKFEEGYNNE